MQTFEDFPSETLHVAESVRRVDVIDRKRQSIEGMMGGSSIEHHLHPGHHVATRSGIKLLADILKPRLPYRGPQLCHGLPRSTLFNQLHIAMAAIDADIAQLRHDPGP